MPPTATLIHVFGISIRKIHFGANGFRIYTRKNKKGDSLHQPPKAVRSHTSIFPARHRPISTASAAEAGSDTWPAARPFSDGQEE